MAWQAQQLFFSFRPQVVETLRAIPSLAGSIYHVTEVRDVNAFPDEGLIVVRELGDPDDHRVNVNWHCFDGTAFDRETLWPKISEELCLATAPGWWGRKNPPAGLRRVAGNLAHLTRSGSAYVGIETWGGTIEYALAWSWDGAGEKETFHRAADSSDGTFDPGGVPAGVFEVTARRARFIRGGGVLARALRPLGVKLNDGYFEPHTSRFDWDEVRIG